MADVSRPALTVMARSPPPGAAVWRPLLFGVRLTAAVSAALFIAFYLQLENPSWAGTSAAIVCQPVLGASLRKGVFRLIGTIIGAVATVLLTACFPQDRIGFLLGMAIWCGLCSFVSTLLRNFSAYAAMLAGYTMAIIASSSIPSPDQVFMLALSRGTEIAVGIVCGMVIMSLTDAGRSSDQLASSVSSLMAEIAAGLLAQLRQPGTSDEPFRARRRSLIKRVAALDSQLDQTVGEKPAVGARRTTVRAGIQGLFLALSAWRTLGAHLQRLPPDEAHRQALALRAQLPERLEQRAERQAAGESGERDRPAAAVGFREDCFERARICRDRPFQSPSLRLGADRIASVLEGLGRAANAVVLLSDTSRALALRAVRRSLTPDILPPLANGLRVFLAVGAAALFYIVTAWPAGLTFITFLTVTVILQSPRDEAGFSAAVGFGLGMLLTAAIAGVIKFGVLPNHESFSSFVLIIGLALVPMAALSTVPALSPVFVAAAVNFIPLLGPTNEISYDAASFADSAFAIVAGSVAGAAALRVFPPVPPVLRAARLLGLTLRDLRRLAQNPARWRPDRWRSRVYARVLALPEKADPMDGSRLLAALTIGLQLIGLHKAGQEAKCDPGLVRSVQRAIAAGDPAAAQDRLVEVSNSLEGRQPGVPDQARLRLQGAAQEISDMLATYRDYFGAEIR